MGNDIRSFMMKEFFKRKTKSVSATNAAPEKIVNKSYASGQKPILRQELYADDASLNPSLSAQKQRESLFGN